MTCFLIFVPRQNNRARWKEPQQGGHFRIDSAMATSKRSLFLPRSKTARIVWSLGFLCVVWFGVYIHAFRVLVRFDEQSKGAVTDTRRIPSSLDSVRVRPPKPTGLDANGEPEQTATMVQKRSPPGQPNELDAIRQERPVENAVENERTTATAKPPKTNVIFYNMFFPVRGTKVAWRIVGEQLRQVNESVHSSNHLNTTIHFTVIGANISEWAGTGPDLIQTVCGPLGQPCVFEGYYPEGNEEITLTKLWNHCKQNRGDRVIYLHNKGSFHRSTNNIKTRRLSTRAAVSEACLGMPLDKETYPCNVCGLTFHLLPLMHWTSNMWAAECAYISALDSPDDYHARRLEWYSNLYHHHTNRSCVVERDNPVWLPPPIDNLQQQDYIDEGSEDEDESEGKEVDTERENKEEGTTEDKVPIPDGVLKKQGLGRYAMERWISSHQSMLPCDAMGQKLSSIHFGGLDFEPELQKARSLQNTERTDLQTLRVNQALFLSKNEQIYMHGKAATRAQELPFIDYANTLGISLDLCGGYEKSRLAIVKRQKLRKIKRMRRRNRTLAELSSTRLR